MPMSNPVVFINGYLSEMIPKYLNAYGSSTFNYFDNAMNFFPVSPTTINELTEQLPSASEAPFAVYDRMLRFRRGPFPHSKKEQLIYYFYKTTTSSFETATGALIETVQAVTDLIDRGDESAQEINSWIQSKLDNNGLYTIGGVSFYPVYFHDTQVFQLEEVRDIIDFGTARTYAGNKLIIDYCYHASESLSLKIPFDSNDPFILADRNDFPNVNPYFAQDARDAKEAEQENNY